jgi:hypothetical protein
MKSISMSGRAWQGGRGKSYARQATYIYPNLVLDGLTEEPGSHSGLGCAEAIAGKPDAMAVRVLDGHPLHLLIRVLQQSPKGLIFR